ncbi:MAG: carbon-nitrogen hydrolase family protein [Lautropia sp.]
MRDDLKISLIQTNTAADRAANLRQATDLMRAAVDSDRPDLLVLPEYCDFYGGEREGKLEAASEPPGGAAYEAMQAFARQHRVWVHAGSMLERIPGDKRVYNTSVVFDRAGNEVARYRKIHLFDIDAPDGTEYRESATIKAGDDIVLYDLEGFKVGCAICFDIRFTELFTELVRQGAELIMLPAAFALQTGKDHWEVLCRARAIETQTYFIAPAQTGFHVANGERRMTYGHSLACDPWGHVVARVSDGIGFTTTRISRAQIKRARGLIPMQSAYRSLAGSAR